MCDKKRYRITTFGRKLNWKFGVTGVMTGSYTETELETLKTNVERRDAKAGIKDYIKIEEA